MVEIRRAIEIHFPPAPFTTAPFPVHDNRAHLGAGQRELPIRFPLLRFALGAVGLRLRHEREGHHAWNLENLRRHVFRAESHTYAHRSRQVSR